MFSILSNDNSKIKEKKDNNLDSDQLIVSILWVMKKRLINLFNLFLYSGLDKTGNIDVIRYHVTINVLNAFGSSFLLYFSVKRFLEGYIVMSIMDLIIGLVLILNIIFLRLTKKHFLSGLITSMVIMLFFVFLFANGSVNRSGSTWSFLAPLFVSSMVGRRSGSIMMAIYFFLSLSIVTIFSSLPFYRANYDLEYLIVHFSVLFLVSMLGYIVESVRDNTQKRLIDSNLEKERVTEALRQSQKLESLGQLAGGVAHDINNMMCVVSGYSELLLTKLKHYGQGDAHYAETILQTSKRTSDLTAKLLAFARKGKYEVRDIDFNNLILETVRLVERTIDPRITIEMNLQADDCYVSGDKSQLENALLNLILNARDAMPNGGKLTINTSNIFSTAKLLVCNVADTGIGMNDDIKKRLFEPFFTTKELGKGSGLGLASVYGTLKSHNGSIEVQSEKEKGSVFTLYLPVVDSVKKTDPLSRTEIMKVSVKAKILVVEDEMVIRELLLEFLESNGFVVFLCANGAEAVSYYVEHGKDIDLVLLDMIMPVMDGYASFRELRKIDENVKVIVMSGYSIDSDAQKMLDEGALAFIQKPFTEEALVTAIRNVVML
jgi:signal transduction histidine kinase